jgi:hypothetical protein
VVDGSGALLLVSPSSSPATTKERAFATSVLQLSNSAITRVSLAADARHRPDSLSGLGKPVVTRAWRLRQALFFLKTRKRGSQAQHLHRADAKSRSPAIALAC